MTEQRIIYGRLYEIIKWEITDEQGNKIKKEYPLIVIDDANNWFNLNKYQALKRGREYVRNELDEQREIYNFQSPNLAKHDFYRRIDRLLEGGDYITYKEPVRQVESLKYYVENWDAMGIKEFNDSISDRLFMIDYSFSDELIINEFKKCLADKRTKQGRMVSLKLTEIEFKKVINYRVIPYIDLILWQKITGNKLTQKEIIELLYPDDRNKDPDFLRKTLTPLAERILYSDTNLI